MRRLAIRGAPVAIMGPLLGGCLLLAATLLLFPNRFQIADAIRRATGGMVAPTPVTVALPLSADILAQRFARGDRLAAPDLRRLIAYSTPMASAQSLSAMADALAASGEAVPTEQMAQDILAGGRPAIAHAFIERRSDRAVPELWRLRFEIARKAGDRSGASGLLESAAAAPGAASAKDLIEAAYELDRPDLIVLAAEHGAIPKLDHAQALDIARWAVSARRHDLIPRIDRASAADWRAGDPWLAMTLARQAGDTAAALRYAALLPSGRDAAREAIIMDSGDAAAIRALLLTRAGASGSDRSVIAQQLLERGFRGDAIGLLRQDAAGRAPDAPAPRRLLYLMGPRPDADNLAWLRSRAVADPDWLPVYAERERPAAALSFVEGLPSAGQTDMLLLRLRLAAAARDGQAASRALTSLLDGRTLDGDQLSDAAANVPPGLYSRFALPLARARLAAGAAKPSDRLDLAWDAWNHSRASEASGLLRAHLQSYPDDRAALRLMADVETRLHGEKAARPWLERALAASPGDSRGRAEILERLGRTGEAMAIVERLRRIDSRDRDLAILEARLLIAAGNPGRAQKVLSP